jgi:hypothetical protein
LAWFATVTTLCVSVQKNAWKGGSEPNSTEHGERDSSNGSTKRVVAPGPSSPGALLQVRGPLGASLRLCPGLGDQQHPPGSPHGLLSAVREVGAVPGGGVPPVRRHPRLVGPRGPTRKPTFVTGGSRLIWGCIGCLVLAVLILGLISSQRSSVNFAGNRSSPPAIGELQLRYRPIERSAPP